MKNVFLKVFVSGRGEIDEVEKIESSYKGIVREAKKLFKEMRKEDGAEYVREFCSIDVFEDKGVVYVNCNEEETEYYIDCSMYEDDCEKLLEYYRNEKVDEFNDLMMKFWDFY